GLYDMYGNVHQWCEDWHDDDYFKTSPARDPRGPESSPTSERVVRGGSFRNDWWHSRSAARSCKWSPESRYCDLGFRVVCVQRSAPEPEPPTVARREPLRFVGKTEGAISLAFSPDGRLLATGHDNPGAAVRLWDPATGKGVWEFPGQPSACASVTFSADGKQVRGSWGPKASQAWDVQSHRLGEGLSGGSYLSPSWRYRVGVERVDEQVFLSLWSRDEKTEYHRFPVDDNSNVSLAFSADQSRLAFLGRRGMLHFFDLENKRLERNFNVSVGDVASQAATLSPDGKSVLVSYVNGDI